MGKSPPSGILHSTDINRSSQDTQPLRASQTEPVRHGVGGGSTTRHRSIQLALARATNDCDYCIFRKKITNSAHLWDGLPLRGKCQSFGFAIYPRRPLQTSIVPYLHDGSSTRPPPPRVPTVSAAKVFKRPQQTLQGGRQDTYPSPGSRRRPLAFKGGEAALSLPGSPRPG